jgi:HEAT repeat protein
VSEPATKPRTWRPMAAWTAGILLALALVWFVAMFVLPVWQTRSALSECAAKLRTVRDLLGVPSGKPAVWDEALERLGGRQRAARKLWLYIRMPEFAAPRQELAVTLLWWCGEDSLPALIWATDHLRGDARVEAIMAISRLGSGGSLAVVSLIGAADDPDWKVRKATTWAFACMKDAQAVPVLAERLSDENHDVRDHAAFALGEIGAPAGQAVQPLIQMMLSDASSDLRWRAAEALGKIFALVPSKLWEA